MLNLPLNFFRHIYENLGCPCVSGNQGNLSVTVIMHGIEALDSSPGSFPWQHALLVSDGTDALYVLLDQKSSKKMKLPISCPCFIYMPMPTALCESHERVIVVSRPAVTRTSCADDYCFPECPAPLNSMADFSALKMWRERRSVQDVAAEPSNSSSHRGDFCQASVNGVVRKRKEEADDARCTVADLRLEIAALKATIQDRNNLISVLIRERKPAIALPPELWTLIFRHALSIQDPAACRTLMLSPVIKHRAERLRLLRSVVCVSRLWQDAGTCLLYEQVYLEDIGQLSLLVETLNSSRVQGYTRDVAHYIRLIRLDFDVPKSCQMERDACLLVIKEKCSSLESLLISRWPNITSQLTIPANLLNLCLVSDGPHTGLPLQWLKDVIYASPILTRLDLVFTHGHLAPYWIAGISEDVPDGDLLLPRLEEIRLGFSPISPLATFSQRWRTPRLRTLVLFDDLHSLGQYLPFVQTNASNIKHMDVRDDDTILENALMLANMCPILEHLCVPRLKGSVYDGHTDFESILEEKRFGHPTIQYIDAWSSRVNDFLPISKTRSKGFISGFPALLRIRALDELLLDVMEDLPLFLPPSNYPGFGVTRHRILDVQLMETSRAIFLAGGMLVQDANGEWIADKCPVPDLSHGATNLVISAAAQEENGIDESVTNGDESLFWPGSDCYMSEWDSDIDAEIGSEEGFIDEELAEGHQEQLTREEILGRWRNTRQR